MPRIPDEELERLKREVDLASLARSKNIELKPHGSKDLIGKCPFHDDDSPSFVVTPSKNLFHCMGCGAAGSVVDFVMKRDGVSFRHAVELLREQNPRLYGGDAVKVSTVPKLESPVAFDADDQTLFKQTLGYYQERLKANPAALDYLASRGIKGEEALKTFRIGFADRTLGLRLPQKNRKDGQEVRERLTRIGLYRESGHEHFNGCLVFPVCDERGLVTEVYGRKVGKQKSGIYHLYLPGPHRGLFNASAFESPEVILAESVIDALTFWVNGLRNVTCIYGTEGFTDEHLEAFRANRTQRVYLAYDRDKAGDRAAERDASRLQSLGIECFRIKLPPGMDPNEYALKVTPAEKSLAVLIKGAEWLGKGEVSPDIKDKAVSKDDASRTSSSSELAANVSCSEGKATKDEIRQDGNGVARSVAEGEAIGVPSEPRAEQKMVESRQEGDDWLFSIVDREYRVRGLAKNTSFEVLKVNLRLWHDERFHLDTLDFYRAKERAHFIAAAASETNLEPDLVKRDLGKVLLALEEVQEKRIREAMEPEKEEVALGDLDRKAAMELLRAPNLLERIVADFARCGIVGEATNILTGYLAAVSRKLDRPLAIIIQSTSAAGKTSLMEAVLEMMPEEERVKYSAMTGQSLYYLGETNLKHKILAIVEEEGAEKASYALKLLQSEGELTIASTGKDDQGRMKTEEYHVEGPVMIFLTTTAIDIDEELLNRCLVLTVDESREQTRAIHDLQREAETFEGLRTKVERKRILDTHRNAQRLLKPLSVVNPFARRLTFLSDRTRTRRDHVKYLTLIRSIALLQQYQRPLKEKDGLQFIEVELSDIEAANKIAHEVLGRSLDELPPQTRRLLALLRQMIEARCKEKGMEREDCLFTRRNVRTFTGWSNTQLKVHLDRLEDFEYILPHRGTRGTSYEYELLFDGDLSTEKPQLVGLIDTEKLKCDTEFTGVNEKFAGPKRPPNGAFTESTLAVEASVERASPLNGYESAENARAPEILAGVVS